ncbi:helix-turn-helix transcriptional regulator [Sphaerisporangium perillae]|uniref:helix-turn-helix transcriptional regulator n=1 Tax=Sphaerisporangium perillae TaxID=2935860 RepID=UPI0027DF026F|nr:helix-turn-helix transcriptional regulator [Sphaerisporangium perillae]
MPVNGQDLIGQRIKTTRRQRGLSQAQLAHPELSDSYVSLIESGKRTPTAAVLELLAAKLECSLTYLINGVTAEQMQDLELRLGYASLALNNGEVAEARRRYAELLEDGSLAGLRSLMQQAEYGYALAAEACGDLDEAIIVLSRLRDATGSTLPAEQVVAIAVALSRCYRERGDLAAAVQVGEETLLGAGRPTWNDDLVELGSTLLGAYIVRGDLLRARQFSVELLAAAEMLGTPRSTVAACWNAAVVADITGRSDEAISLVERALAVQSETGEPRNLARLRMEYAVLLLRTRPAEAAACRDLMLRGERELAESSAGAVDLARAAIYLAKAEIVLGDAKKAAEHARRGRDMLDERTPALLAEARLVLGNALLLLDEAPEASVELMAVERSLEHSPASRKAAEGWLATAMVLEHLDGGEGSVAAYQRALASVGL